MHIMPGGPRRIAALVAIPLLLVVSACGASKSDATPTVSVEEIFTSAAQTFDAQQATELALTPPTKTPAPTFTPFPTLPPIASPSGPVPTISFDTPAVAGTDVSGGSAPSCANSVMVSETIPDGTKMLPNQNFKKSWTFLNNGTCPWDSTYQLAFLSGNSMGGATTHVPLQVAPGTQITFTIPMQAPSAYGDYQGYWQLQNAQNQGFGSRVWVLIKVRLADVTDTPTP